MGDGRFRCVKSYGGGRSTDDGRCEGPDSYGRGQEGHGDNHVGLPSSYLWTQLDRHLDWWGCVGVVCGERCYIVYIL